MIVVIPYAGGLLRDETVAAAMASGLTVQAVCVDPSPSAPPGSLGYWELLRDLWSAGESFINIEQDIVVHSEAIPTMAACGHLWCGYTYAFGEESPCEFPFFGCTHFDAALMAEHPDAIDAARGGWHNLDERVKASLGVTQEVHHPPVMHLHQYE